MKWIALAVGAGLLLLPSAKPGQTVIGRRAPTPPLPPPAPPEGLDKAREEFNRINAGGCVLAAQKIGLRGDDVAKYCDGYLKYLTPAGLAQVGYDFATDPGGTLKKAWDDINPF